MNNTRVRARPRSRVAPLPAVIAALALGLAAAPSSGAGSKCSFAELEVKSRFVLNFARLVNWSDLRDERNSSELPICALEVSDFASAVQRVAEGKTVAGRVVRMRIEPAPHPSRCRILIVDSSQYRFARQALNAVRDQPVLTIGNEPGFLDCGGMFELAVQDGNVKFDASLDAIRLAGLDVSARLLRLARVLRGGATSVD